jgi:hypothetical protein
LTAIASAASSQREGTADDVAVDMLRVDLPKKRDLPAIIIAAQPESGGGQVERDPEAIGLGCGGLPRHNTNARESLPRRFDVGEKHVYDDNHPSDNQRRSHRARD